MTPLHPTEWLLMRAVWDLGPSDPITVSEHVRARYGRSYDPKTTGVLLSRLVVKGYLQVTPMSIPRGRPRHVYSSLVTFEDALRPIIESFLDNYKIDAEALDKAIGSSLGELRQALKHTG